MSCKLYGYPKNNEIFINENPVIKNIVLTELNSQNKSFLKIYRNNHNIYMSLVFFSHILFSKAPNFIFRSTLKFVGFLYSRNQKLVPHEQLISILRINLNMIRSVCIFFCFA